MQQSNFRSSVCACLLCLSHTFKNNKIIVGQRLTEVFLSFQFLFFHPVFPAIVFTFIWKVTLPRHTCNQWKLILVSYPSDPHNDPLSLFHPSNWSCLFSLFNSYNSLTEVEGSEFRSLRQLEMLMLHGNDISTVHPGAFYSLRSLQVKFVLCLCVYLILTLNVSSKSNRLLSLD